MTSNNLRLPRKLWTNQREAIYLVDRYLASGSNDRAALITMPTGTGKSGVIAASVVYPSALKGHRLILTPWKALVRQLIRDVEERFWTSASIKPPKDLPEVKRLPKSRQAWDEIRGTSSPTVFVGTFQGIQTLSKWLSSKGQSMEQLFEGFDLALVDEGHYEPAQEWSQSVRSMKLPIVLLTATPYRNDSKYFDVDLAKLRYRYSHSDAQESGLLRKPEFRTLGSESESEFAGDVVSHLREMLSEHPDSRVIVRCETGEAVRRLTYEFNAIGEQSCGIHHTFNSDGTLWKNAPSPIEHEAKIWVHQNQLIEGIDDPRFRIVAFFNSLTNDRAMVQQIGRILRNPTRSTTDRRAIVLDRGDRDSATIWNAYMKFDQDDGNAVASLPSLAHQILEAQPATFYFDGAFREQLDLASNTSWKSFNFRLRTRVFELRGDSAWTAKALAAEVEKDWKEVDRTVFDTQFPDQDSAVIPYVTTENSPLLRSTAFIEPKFGYTSLCVLGNLLFYDDARGRVPAAILTRFRALPASRLTSLFAKGRSSLTSVALSNTDIGNQAPRSRQISAQSIDGIGPDLTDFAYICTTAEGRTEISGEEFRRYLGFSRARVTDFRPGEQTFLRYKAWLSEIKGSLDNASDSVSTFQRYAKEAPVPSNAEAAHLLLDFDPSDFHHSDVARTPLLMDDRAFPVRATKVDIPLDGVTHSSTLTWNGSQYVLDAPSLSKELIHQSSGDGQELVAYINQQQAMRVVPASARQIYSHGSFYAPVVPSLSKNRFQLLDVMTPIQGLESIQTEKGVKDSTIVGDDWSPDSAFGLISAIAKGNAPIQMQSYFGDLSLLLCTDMGTEVADFIAVGPSRVAFIHAKASATNLRKSASAFHDVASQAIKNLLFLQAISEEKPYTRLWSKPWKAPGITGEVSRLRHGNISGNEALWGHIRDRISDPQVSREVWLVMGSSLSRQELEDQTRKRPPAPEAIQIYSLLQTTWGAVSQTGSRLRVFCSP